ncbi:MAG: hypothetical protein KUL86_06580 [Castellaniella sp.]|nr:hypothetical protein [Castellaniella sp.]
MATDLTYRISVIDDATKKASAIQERLAKIANPLAKLTRGLVDTGRRGTVAISRVEVGLRTIAHTAREASDRIASIVPGLAAVTGMLGAAGVGTIATSWANFGFTLQQTSRQLGMSAQSLQAWHYAAKRAGVTAAAFDQSMVSSQDVIRGAAFGANPQAMMLMNRLGVGISHTKSGDIDYQKTQHDLLGALARIRNPAGQRTAADALGMGSLLPMIQRGTFSADRQRALVDGYAPSAAAIERARVFHDRLVDVGASVSVLSNTIGDKLLPVLQPMIEGFTRWLDAHRVDIADRLTGAVQKFTNWISSVNWSGIYESVNKVVDVFGGWGNVLTGLIAIKFASTLASWTGSIVRFAAGITAAKTAADALKATAGAEAAGAAAGMMRPWWALNPLLLGAGAMVYSKNLGVGEDQMLAAIRAGDGKRSISATKAYPLGAKDPAVVGAVNRFMARGWTAEQASGIVSNLMQESHMNPYAVGDNGLAYGIGQWHPDRQDDFKRVFGHDIRQSTLDEQEKFFDWELRSGKRMTRDAGDMLSGATTAADSGAIVSRYDLRPRDTETQMRERGRLAQEVLAGWQAANGGGNAGATPQININVSAPPGTRVDAANSDGSGLPTRVNYQMLGAMP